MRTTTSCQQDDWLEIHENALCSLHKGRCFNVNPISLITATIGLQAGLITTSLFSIVVMITLVTTLVTPLLLKLVYLARRKEIKRARVTEPLLLDTIEEGVEDILFQEGANVHRTA